MIYVLYSVSADRYFLIGDYASSRDAIEFFHALLNSPPYAVDPANYYLCSAGEFDYSTGAVVSCPVVRVERGASCRGACPPEVKAEETTTDAQKIPSHVQTCTQSAPPLQSTIVSGARRLAQALFSKIRF